MASLETLFLRNFRSLVSIGIKALSICVVLPRKKKETKTRPFPSSAVLHIAWAEIYEKIIVRVARFIHGWL